MKKQIDLIIISYSTAKAITVISCDTWQLCEDATSPAYSTFTFDKSKVNQENFNLIAKDDLIFIKPSDLTGTPFATTTIDGQNVQGGFLQQIETITEDEEQFIIKTKSMTFILDCQFLNRYEFDDRDYTCKEVYNQTTRSSPVSFASKYGNVDYMKLPLYTFRTGNGTQPTIPFEQIPFEFNTLVEIRKILNIALNTEGSSCILLPHINFSSDKVSLTFEFYERATTDLPDEVLNLDESFITGEELALSKSNRPNKVILYPAEDNTLYDDIFALDESGTDAIVLYEGIYTDSDIQDYGDYDVALTKKAYEIMNSEAETNEIKVEIQAGVYDFSQLQLFRSYTLNKRGRQIRSQLTKFEVRSDSLNKINVSFGYKRLSIMSEMRKLRKRIDSKQANNQGASAGVQAVTINTDSSGNTIVEFIR